jgi:hypothetical protein
MKKILMTCIAFLAAHSQASGLLLNDVFTETPSLNPNIPAPAQVIGIEVGERHWYHHEIISYLDALAEASPRMTALGENARTYGGRASVSYAISSPANLAKLNDIKAARASIIDPSSEIDIADHPAVLHMMYSIHGNEPSGANATPLIAYYLNAVNNDEIERQLEDVVIIFTPMQNPDGLDRFAHWTNSHRGQNPSADPNDREHREAVPNGRTNYYWFDLNRDWLAHQHPASRGRLSVFHDWKPNVQLDFHEQGSNSNYFFMPGKPERTNPLTPDINQALTAKIGEYHAAAFDEEGIRYFTEEGYDDFFMGKGSTYPDLFGTVGILFEQPSARGTLQDTVNGQLTFPISIANQFRTSLSSIKATAELKSELLKYQRTFYADRTAPRGHYLASAPGDPTRLNEFVRILKGHQIEVLALSQDATVDGQTYSAQDSIAIPLDQPQSTYLQTLWQAQTEFEENVFYDVSTWTLPWAFNLTHTREPVRNVQTGSPFTTGMSSNEPLPMSKTGYLIDWRDSASPALLYDLLESGANVRVAEKTFTAITIESGSKAFGYGTLFVAPELGEAIPTDVLDLLRSAKANGQPIYAAASAYTPTGIDLGSRDFTVLSVPKVLLVTGPGTSAYSTGEIWHMLDRRVDMPVTMVDTDRLGRTDLSTYSHIIMTTPPRSAGAGIGEKLDEFVSEGGVLWAQGSSTVSWLSGQGLTDVSWRQTQAEIDREKHNAMVTKGASDESAEALLPERKPFVDASDEFAFTLVRGAILEGDLDTSHPLGYGYESSFIPMFRTTNRFMTRSANPYSTPIAYSGEPLLSGYMSEENRQLAANSASLIVDGKGDGAIVLSLDSTTFRAFWWGTQRLMSNAIFFGDLLVEPR